MNTLPILRNDTYPSGLSAVRHSSMPLAVNVSAAPSQKAQGPPTNSTTTTSSLAPHANTAPRQASNGATRPRPTSSQSSHRAQGTQKPHVRTRTPVVQEPSEPDDSKWGSNFWVTLVDPQVYAAPYSKLGNVLTRQTSPEPHSSHVPQQDKSAGTHLSATSCTRLRLPR